MKILCYFGFHKWEWYVANYQRTKIGTQICYRCNSMRGKQLEKGDKRVD